MSNPGLYSSIYQMIREYAELVDAVLIGLKTNLSAGDPQREQLAQRLSDLVGSDKTDLAVKMVALLLAEESEHNATKWTEMSQRLRASIATRSLIDDLEQFARDLEQLQVDALAKMRGWSR